jgi:hypothetical protein
VLTELVLRIFPSRSIAGYKYQKWQVSLLGLLFEGRVQRFDSFAVRTPVSAVVVLLTCEQYDSFGLIGD